MDKIMPDEVIKFLNRKINMPSRMNYSKYSISMYEAARSMIESWREEIEDEITGKSRLPGR